MSRLPCCRYLPLIALLALLSPSRLQSAEPKLATAVQPFVESHGLAGAVMLAATKDEVLALEAVGYADIAANKRMQSDNVFWIASMSKPITAAAVMMLVDEGKIKLDDPVEKYLPEFKGQMVIAEQDESHTLLKKSMHPVTIRNTLNHTSGMRFASPLEQPTLDALRLRDAVRSYALQPLQWEPDSKYQYSNAGINTAARITEVVSGMSYEQFMQDRLFGPLNMKDTTFWPNEKQVQRLAKAYKPTADKTNLEETKISQLTYPLTDKSRQPMPAGGLFSTAADVNLFCQMILRGGTVGNIRFLSENSVNEMTTRQTGEQIKENYGLGWSTGGNTFGHGGALATNMSIDKERGLITVWMVQHAGFAADGGKAHGVFQEAARALVK